MRLLNAWMVGACCLLLAGGLQAQQKDPDEPQEPAGLVTPPAPPAADAGPPAAPAEAIDGGAPTAPVTPDGGLPPSTEIQLDADGGIVQPSNEGIPSLDGGPPTKVTVVSSGSKDAEKGKAVDVVGRSQGYQDTRVSDRSPNLMGQTGLLRVTSARAGKGGYFDFGLHGRAFYMAEEIFFTGGPFITDCARRAGKRTCDTYISTVLWGAGTFGVTVFDYVELSLAGMGSGHENSESRPRVLLSTGNIAASVKVSLPVVVWTKKLPQMLKLEKPASLIFPIPLAFGLDVRGYMPSRVGSLGVQPDNLNLGLRGLMTVDLYEGRGWPFRAHFNAGYVFQSPFSIERSLARQALARDDTRLLRGANGAAAAVGYDYTYFDMFSYGVGVELPFPFVTPFVEYSGEVPVPIPAPIKAEAPGTFNGQTPLGTNGNVMTDPFAWPSRLTPGLRVTPGRGLAFDLAVDIGLGGRTTITDGIATQLPWAAMIGVSYTFSPFVAETQVEIREVEKKVEVKKVIASVKAGGKIGGTVIDAKTGEPIPDAILNFPGAGPDILAEGDGRYESYPMEPGIYEVIAEAIDYDEAKATVEVRAGQTTKVDLRLNPHPRAAYFKATVVNEKDQAVKATVLLTDAKGRSFTLEAPDGSVEAELPPGKYNAKAKAEGYLLSGKSVVIEPDLRTAEVFLLKTEPKKRLTVLTKERIEIKSTIHFEYNKARLLTSSSFILDEVVDTLLKNPQIEKMRVEGHTDNTGDPEYNQRLSQARAEAVLEYLTRNGVEPERVEAVGYGDTRPLAPNTSESGRARNRRVEFVIVHPDAPAPAPAPAAGEEKQ